MFDIIAVAFGIILIASACYVFIYGGATGKWGAVITICAWLATLIFWYQATTFTNAMTNVLTVDIMCLIGFLILALKSHRYWPIWASGLQLTAVISHFVIYTAPHVIPNVYQAINGIWSIPIVAIMVFGTALDNNYKMNHL